jgi:hypothetical protein
MGRVKRQPAQPCVRGFGVKTYAAPQDAIQKPQRKIALVSFPGAYKLDSPTHASEICSEIPEVGLNACFALSVEL